ncbi:Crp/Fnr family transcriptional regulator [Sphingobium boeckii]|uniref:CRP-like cAMP-binding protein n=1 Tax=Sphingobium boeckii TaxID=1082345 RepID=A0A7W9ED34_9SPHN|nr:Crp/Fnr family transcriptional regulator [Sphingobium boeckii]MBB5684529.1 CRP-like cAMP-binding protein [Sphingobium boeckii]
MTGSCFAERLARYVPLTDSEKRALERLENNPRDLPRGATITRENDNCDEMYVLRHGWAMSYLILDDGSRQILRLHFPGDMFGTSSAAFGEATESLVTMSHATLCPFDKQALRVVFDEHPRLAALFFIIAQAERVSLTDRLASLGRTSAKARVAALLTDMLVRLRFLNKDISDTIPLKLTQEEIGDATGLTAVHVNRMMRALAEDGLVMRNNGNLVIRDEQGLARIANYVNRYAELDLGWLPAPR